MNIEKHIILKLLKKSLLYRLMENINRLLSKSNADLTHRELSERMGNSANWFNDAYNNNEDIAITSFARLLSVIGQKIDLNEQKLITLFDSKILKISSLISELTDEDERYISNLIKSDKAIFTEILGDWASMDFKNKLNDAEKMVMNQVRELLLEGENVE